MSTATPAKPETRQSAQSDLLIQFARMLDSATELAQMAAELDDMIDDTRLIALNAALEARRSDQGSDAFTAVAEQLNLTVDRLTSGKTEITSKIEELRRELENGPALTTDKAAQPY